MIYHLTPALLVTGAALATEVYAEQAPNEGVTGENATLNSEVPRTELRRGDVAGQSPPLSCRTVSRQPATLGTGLRQGNDPDGDVRRLLGNGDVTGALHQLMQRHGAAVYRYCHEELRDAALADDVHQHVFIEAFRDLPRYEGRSSVRTWLFAIARNRVLDAAKARSRAQSHLEEAEVQDTPDPRPLPGESIDDTRLRQALIASVGELGHHARTAVLLRYQQGFTFEEMAEICREKPGTLQARVTRALQQLRARIEACIGGPRAVSRLDRCNGHSR